jgi:ADP-heptose:LPS heptosyltransferase
MTIIQSIKQINRDIKTITRPIRDIIAKFILDKKQKTNKILKFNEIKTILFLRDDNKIGDMVVSTILFREIKKKYPKIKIIVLSGKDSKEIIKYNPYVDEIIETRGELLKDLVIYFKLRKYKIDVIVDTLSFDPRPLYLLKLRIINPYFLIGYDKAHYNVYDHTIKSDNYSHITQKYGWLLDCFLMDNYSFDYDIFFGDLKHENSDIDNINIKNKIVINPFAASLHKTFKSAKLQELVDKIKSKIQCNIFILCQNNNYNHIKNLQDVTILKVGSPLETAHIISKCDYVVTPDTSVVHIARAFNRKMIVLYLDSSNNEEKTDKIWAPAYDNAVQIFVDTENGRFSNDIDNINTDFIVETMCKINL